jgi:hypothetical protein
VDEEQDAYEVAEDERGFHVRDSSGMTIMTCRDRRSADHYATLLDKAYRKGFKAGYRAGRRND